MSTFSRARDNINAERLQGQYRDGEKRQLNQRNAGGGLRGAAFDAQSVTIEDGSSLTVTMTRDCQMFASSASTQIVSTLSGNGSDGKLRLQEGGELTIIVESGTTDLTGVLTGDTDLSQVKFQVDGLLVLPEGSDPDDLTGNITGSGSVLIRSAARRAAAATRFIPFRTES